MMTVNKRERRVIGGALLVGLGLLVYFYGVEPLQEWRQSGAEMIPSREAQLERRRLVVAQRATLMAELETLNQQLQTRAPRWLQGPTPPLAASARIASYDPAVTITCRCSARPPQTTTAAWHRRSDSRRPAVPGPTGAAPRTTGRGSGPGRAARAGHGPLRRSGTPSATIRFRLGSPSRLIMPPPCSGTKNSR